MGRKATAGQKAMAKKYGVRLTKTVRGTRVELDAETLKKKTLEAKLKLAKRKERAKKKTASNRQLSTGLGNPHNKSDDRRIVGATPAGKRKSKKTSVITYRTKDPKTGKIVEKKVRRRNANQTGKVEGGRTYTERRANRTDKGKFL